MNIEILTPDKTLFSGTADVLTLPGINGSFQILKDHAPLIANLGKGTLNIKAAGKSESFEIKGGLVEVLKNKVVVLV
ncbi:MAG: F0F1 ATP synthase subunit epsilon [Bacteroidetes bacterium]|nr:F0F1 ATP synthase subunit epsilon [Bacteroidota bacterium]